jgi:hypothetical protein
MKDLEADLGFGWGKKVGLNDFCDISLEAWYYSRSDPKATKRSLFYAHNNFLTTTLINLY